MSRKVKYSIEEKLNAVQKYLDGKESMYSIANRFGIDDIVNIGLHFILKNVRPYAAPCSEA